MPLSEVFSSLESLVNMSTLKILTLTNPFLFDFETLLTTLKRHTQAHLHQSSPLGKFHLR